METQEISLNQLRLFEFVRDAGKWVSMREIVTATGSARETVGLHCRRFVKLGIFDQAEVWPGHRFRIAELADKRNSAIMERLKKAREVFGSNPA